MRFVTCTMKYLNQQYQQTKLVLHAWVKPFNDYLFILISKEARLTLLQHLERQSVGIREVAHVRRNNTLETVENSYIDIFGNLCTYVKVDQEENVYFIDGVVEVFTPFDEFNGTNVVYFYQENEEL